MLYSPGHPRGADWGQSSKVEYRAVNEPVEEIDYVIRYYPGPGAADSITRIQGQIQKGKTQRSIPADGVPPIQRSQPG